MSIPVIIYAVTFGSFKSFVTHVIANPQNSISAIEIIIDATGEALRKISCSPFIARQILLSCFFTGY